MLCQIIVTIQNRFQYPIDNKFFELFILHVGFKDY